jgi:co-chaperonin GroES (HSP10)
MTIETKQLLDDMVAIQLDAEPASKGRIKLPDWQKYLHGTVIAVGPGKPLYTGGRGPMACQVGNKVSFAPTAGMDADLGVGHAVRLMHDVDVDAIWEDA